MFEHLTREQIERIHTVEVIVLHKEILTPKENKGDVLDCSDDRINTWQMSELFYGALRLSRSPFLKHSGRLPEDRKIIYTDSFGEFCR